MRDRRAGQGRGSSSPSAASGTCWPPSSVRSPTATGSPSTGTASGSSTSRRAPSPTRARSTTARCPARPTSTPCRPTTPRAAAARTGAELQAALARRRRQPGRRGQDLGHRAVRPLRPRQHRAGPARGRRRRPHRRDRPTAASRSPSTATPASPGSTPTPAPSSTSPRPTATSPSPVPTPLAVTNCLNFGSPEEPEVMWQFAEAVRGLADGCRELGLPVTGGNVSLYNQTGDVPINPTPVIGVLGVHDDVRRRVSARLADGGRDRAAARRDPRGVRRLGLGRGRARPPRRAAARGRPARRARAGRAAGGAGRRRSGQLRARPGRRRAGAGARRVRAALRRRRRGWRLDGDPFTALFSESAARAVVTTADPAGRAGRRRGGRRPGHRAGDDGRRRPGRRRRCSSCRWPSCGRPGRRRCRRCSARPRRRSAPSRRAPSPPADGRHRRRSRPTTLRAAVDPVRALAARGGRAAARARCSVPR